MGKKNNVLDELEENGETCLVFPEEEDVENMKKNILNEYPNALITSKGNFGLCYAKEPDKYIPKNLDEK